MYSKEFQVPCGYGVIFGQVFSAQEDEDLSGKKPIISIHGYLDNSNSFKLIAESLLKNNDFEYYIISIDMPGMGFSTKLPDGIPYSPKVYQMTIRRIVKHFKLTKFTFMCHSMGCSHPLIYSSCFPSEVERIINFDFAMFDVKFDRKHDMAASWKDNIDTYLNGEKELQEKQTPSRELTFEHALNRLLFDNKFIDERAARVLLERGLRATADSNKLEYTRDIRFVACMSITDYHAEFWTLWDSVFAKLRNVPMLFVYAANPFPYGQGYFNDVCKLMDELTKHNEVTRVAVNDAGHHLHMMKPDETASIVIDYLTNKNKVVDDNNNIHSETHSVIVSSTTIAAE
jgi:pimeloyl-ACP methyl ester carboxylesterase